MTPLLVKPTIEEIRFAATKIGLPETEADKFWYHYESNGWKVGRVPMKSMNSALAGWKIRWQERRQVNGQPRPLNGAQVIVLRDELDRIIEKMRRMKASYSEHQSWSKADKDRWTQLVDRRKEVMRLLGVKE